MAIIKRTIGVLLSIAMIITAFPINSAEAYEYPGIYSEDDFKSCELLIATSDPSIFTADTEVVSEYMGIYLVRFPDQKATEEAYYQYLKLADYVDVNSEIRAAGKNKKKKKNKKKEKEGADLSELNNGDDAFSNVNEIKVKDYSGCIALIDTGASTSNVIYSVSVIGDEVGDDNGHGTKMAEQIASANPNAKILSIKALDNNAVGNLADVYAAIMYAIESNASVINLSMASIAAAESDTLRMAVMEAVEKGIKVVASAGNKGKDAAYFVPAGIPGVITAGACDENGVRIGLSNYGSSVNYYVEANSTSYSAAKLSAYLLSDSLDKVTDREDVFTREEVEEPKVKEEKKEENKEKTEIKKEEKNNEKENQKKSESDEKNNSSETDGTEKSNDNQASSEKDNKINDKENQSKAHLVTEEEMLRQILIEANATPSDGSGFPHYINDVTATIYQTSKSGASFTGYISSANVPSSSRYYNKLQLGGVSCSCAGRNHREGGCADPGPGSHKISNLQFEYVSSSNGTATYAAASNVDGQTHANGYQIMYLSLKLDQQNSFISIQKQLAGNPKNNLKNVYFDVYDNKNATGTPLGYMRTSSGSGVAHNVYEDKNITTLTHSSSTGLSGSLDLPPGSTVYLFEVGQGSSYNDAKNKVPSDSKYKTDAAHEAGEPNVTKYAIDMLPNDSKYIARYTVKTTATKGSAETTLSNPIEEFVFIYKKDEYGNELGANYEIYGATSEVNLNSSNRQALITQIKGAINSKLVTTLTVEDGFGVADVSSYKRDNMDDDRFYYAVEVENSQDSAHAVSLPFRASSRTYKPNKGEYGYTINTDIEDHYYYKVGIYKYDDEGKTVAADFDIYYTAVSGATSGGTKLGSVKTNGSTGYAVMDVTKDYVASVSKKTPHYYYAVETATDEDHVIQDPKETVLKVVKGIRPDFSLSSADYVKKLNPKKPIPPIRTDIELQKVDEGGNTVSGVKFKVTSKTLGQSVTLVTDENGYVSTAASYVKHSINTNAGTAKCGTWFGDINILDDKMGALPEGEYSIKELRCDANKGMQLEKEQIFLVNESNKDSVIKIYDNEVKETENKIWNMTRPVIHTNATVVETNEKLLAVKGCDSSIDYTNQTIKDEISYKKLRRNTEYTFLAELMQVDDENVTPYMKDDKPLRAVKSFTTVKGSSKSIYNIDGTETVELTGVDPTGLDGKIKRLVIYESLYLGTYSSPEEIDAAAESGKIKSRYDEYDETDDMDFFPVTHKDKDDADQTIYYSRFKTTASLEETIKDTLNYINLPSGQSFIARGTLMDKESGEVMKDASGKEITGEKSFETEKDDGSNPFSSGMVEVVFNDYDITNLGGKTGVVFEEIYLVTNTETKIGEHKDIEDVDQFVYFQKIRTNAKDSTTGSKVVPNDMETVIKDTVTYKNVIPGKEYMLTATLHVKGDKSGNYKDGDVLLDKEGNPVTASFKFVPEEKDGEAVVEIPFNSEGLRGMEIVVFEDLKNEYGLLVACHNDLTDENQTLDIPGGSTKAVDKDSGTQVTEPDKTVTLVDTVSYENLEIGKEYYVTGTLYSKSTELPIRSGDDPVTSTVTFKPETRNGTVDVTFNFSTKYLAGSTIVIFEDMFYKSKDEKDVLVFSHHDINEKNQTIYVNEKKDKITTESKTESKLEKKVKKIKTVKKNKSPETGDRVPVIPLIVDMILAIGGIVIILTWKKKKR